MHGERLQTLFLEGYTPATLLDIGAHLGAFTRDFLALFPECEPTVIEPNPFCAAALTATGHAFHPVAASDAPGEAELFLTREWPQSTGASLYRENTPHFRDAVTFRQSVPKVRLDDLLPNQRFDFVKIDTQGAELDVLRGAERIIRQADFVLLEISLTNYNQGGARAEAIMVRMTELGFRCVEIPEFHRIAGVRDGDVIQIDILFERIITRPSHAVAVTRADDLSAPLTWLQREQSRCTDFSVLSVFPGTTSDNVTILSVTHPEKISGWEAALAHVAAQGRFRYALCGPGLADLENPELVLEMLPRVAEAGLLTLPLAGARWRILPGPTGLVLAQSPTHAPTHALWPGWELRMAWRGRIARHHAQPEDRTALAAEVATLTRLKRAGANAETVLAETRRLVNPAIAACNHHLAAGEMAAASFLAEALCEMLPRHAPFREIAATCLQAQGRAAPAARHRAALANATPPAHPDNALNDLLALRDAHDQISEILTTTPNPSALEQATHLRKSALQAAATAIIPPGDATAWARHYRLMITAMNPDHLAQPPEAVTTTARDLEAQDGLLPPAKLSKLRAAVARTAAEIVFLAVADMDYLRRYGPWFARSILARCDLPCAVVIHVIGGAGQIAAARATLGITDPRLILSIDAQNIPAIPCASIDAPPKGQAAKPIAHLQSTRFLLARRLLAALARPLIICDIDTILQRGVADLLATHANAALVVNENTASRHAGSRYTANLLLARPGPATESLFAFMQTYLTHHLAGSDVTRWIDQFGLLLGLLHTRQHFPSARIGLFDTASDINNVIYPTYQANPFRFLSLYHGFDMSTLPTQTRVAA